MNLARVCMLVVGLAVTVPVPVLGAQTTSTKKTTASTTRKSSIKKTTYSASSSAARKARLARARAAANTREQVRLRSLHRVVQDAMTPRFKTGADGELVPDVRAAAAIIFDPKTGQILWQENAQDKRSIASITKVMTAVVFLEDNPDLSQVVTVDRVDTY